MTTKRTKKVRIGWVKGVVYSEDPELKFNVFDSLLSVERVIDVNFTPWLENYHRSSESEI
jgi:hypothetical protein